MVIKRGASDMIFVAGAPPVIWVLGRMQPVGSDRLNHDSIANCFLPLLSADQRERLDSVGDVDLSFGKAGVGRLRVNVHRQRGTLSVACRFIPQEVPSFDTLKLPLRVRDLADLPHGLVLITGGAATGKTTTLAALVNHINHNYAYHVITLEDPVEFSFAHGKSIIEQREVGQDCESFASALRHIVRQRPDVILVGEMRDLETISAALTAAEIGHLVLASLHTSNATETVNRIIDIFPANQQLQVRVQLSSILQGVVCQTLFRDECDGGLIPAVEIMIPNPAIRRAIRDSETHLIIGMIEMGKAAGMQTIDSAIAELISAGKVSLADGLAKAANPEKLARLVA
ncbi:MAG: PilT/PilU family type 4a pilus ATPase [Phycisphaerae bacterium]|nr:PilT/PilU family type 4a pilus ATPase [Phycisphaerae bacterium]